MNIGFIGLGKMGSGLAKNLIRAGFHVRLFDINPAAIESVLQTGGIKSSSPEELALHSEVVFTSLPLPAHLLELTIDQGKIFQVMQPGSVLIDVSTVDPQTARKVADAAEKHLLHFLACPLGKGPAQAEAGTEPIFAGGKKAVFDKYKPILEKISTQVTYLGDVEQSTAFKLISNMVGMTNLAVLSEGVQLAVQSGIDPFQFKELMHETGGDSAQFHLRGPLILNDEYTPMFSVNLAEKDVRLGVQMAESMKNSAAFSRLALQYLQTAQSIGLGDQDAAAVYRAFQHNQYVES